DRGGDLDGVGDPRLPGPQRRVDEGPQGREAVQHPPLHERPRGAGGQLAGPAGASGLDGRAQRRAPGAGRAGAQGAPRRPRHAEHRRPAPEERVVAGAGRGDPRHGPGGRVHGLRRAGADGAGPRPGPGRRGRPALPVVRGHPEVGHDLLRAEPRAGRPRPGREGRPGLRRVPGAGHDADRLPGRLPAGDGPRGRRPPGHRQRRGDALRPPGRRRPPGQARRRPPPPRRSRLSPSGAGNSPPAGAVARNADPGGSILGNAPAGHPAARGEKSMASFRDLLKSTKAQIREVTAEQAEALLGRATFLDVREADEFEQGTIPGSVFIPRGNLELVVEGKIPDKDGPVVVYCAGGARSAFAAKSLAELGYTDVVNMAGGFNQWKNEGRNWVTPQSLSAEQRNRYHRHLLLPEVGDAGQQKLLGSSVLLLGAGGLGSPAALYLAAAGVGTLGIIDMDVVDASNLQRQILHNMDRVGERKVDSAKKTLTALNP